ncbi:MAG TPA: Mur ligase family protein, partial [Polyangiaceae bacterium]|nr:Mur ligase family protein [Polyangiaceae bacterium]
MRVHVIAVSGTGMGPLAGLLSSLGHEVSGSDVAFDPPIGPRLREWGIRCLEGFDPAHLKYGPDLVVIGNLCRADNPEARFAIDTGLPYTHIGGALQRFVLPGTRPVIVAGTHGKTTTSSLTAGLLEAVGKTPGFLIGGVPQGLDRSFRAPAERVRSLLRPSEAPPFVIEGDEYDTAFFEKTAKFLHYSAELVILTSIEQDHVDIYPTLESYLRPFELLVQRLPETGLVVANAADEHVVRIVREHARAQVIWYALEGQETFGVAPHWLAAPAAADGSGSSFDLFLAGVRLGRWVTPLMGRHNVANVTAALALTTHGFQVAPESLRVAVASLRGAARRQDLLGTPDGVYVYDDFAHHPTAVRETLLGFRSRHPDAKVFAVFEPRSATASRKLHQAVYPDALAVADVALLAPVARKLPSEERLDVEEVARAVLARGKRAAALGSVDEIVARLARETKSGDVVAIFSNGTFGGIHA